MNHLHAGDHNHARANLVDHLELVGQRDLALMRLEEMAQ